MKWIFTDEFISMNNVNKLTFDTHWSPQGVNCTPVLCVDIYLSINCGEAYRYIHRCESRQFNLSKLKDRFISFIDANLVHVFDFDKICKDIELDEDIDNR